MRTNLQIGIERQRAVYDMPRPMLAQLAEVHDLSVRNFAEVFSISKSHAEEILNHKKLPSLELGVRIARYYECSVEDVFGWRIDDEGMRRPLVVRAPGGKAYMTLNARYKGHGALALLKAMIDKLRGKKEAEHEEAGAVVEGSERGVRDVPNVEAADSSGN